MIHQFISKKNDPKTRHKGNLEHTQNKIFIHQFVLQKMIQKCNFQM